MGRSDADAEVVRRNNAAARLRPKAIIFAGLPKQTSDAFRPYFPESRVHHVSNLDDLRRTGLVNRDAKPEALRWGKNRFGLGLLEALRSRREIVFSEDSSPDLEIPSDSGHLVICEEGDELAQVIAANYAFSIGAGFRLIPELAQEDADGILERFYSVYENKEQSATSTLEQLRAELRRSSGELDLGGYRCVTFVTREVPWGSAYPEVPSTHLISYPDLGISILNGLLSEERGAPGIRVAVLIDSGEVDAQEIRMAIASLRSRAVFISGITGRRATVHSVSRMVELFPYDLLIISTHCGDAPGWRWTYQFIDSEGLSRRLVVDLTIGVSIVPGDEKLDVTQYMRFVSLDGVDWNDPDKRAKLYFGTAMRDFIELKRGKELEPVKKEPVARVPGSAALKMADGNYLAIPLSLADHGSPIVLNNACASWHRLAKTFVFGNARAYIGTLFSVSDAEAQDVASRLLDRHFGKPLAIALWHAQNEVYERSVRRPYVLVGTHAQRLRTTATDAPMLILGRLRIALQHWTKRQKEIDPNDESKMRTINDYVRFLRNEIEGLHKRWISGR